MVYGISNQNINPGMQEQAMGASSAMIVTGLEKELKNHRVKTDLHDQKVDLKELNEYVQRLSDASEIDKIRKQQDERRGQKKKEEEQKRRPALRLSGGETASPFDWASTGRSSGLLDILKNIESAILRELLKFVLQPNLDELIGLAKDLNLDLSAWKLDKLNINAKGEVLLDSNLSEKERMQILLIDECKVLMIGRLLEESWVKLAVINLRLMRVKSTLKALGIKQEELDNIDLCARRIAFLKLIAQLKDAHLKRVLSNSRKEFDNYSALIKMLTQKVLKIKVDIPQGGIAWIHQRLETLALESARYKLELLRSLQKLSFEKDREKNIRWLETTVARLS